jgi:hypothetical protein
MLILCGCEGLAGARWNQQITRFARYFNHMTNKTISVRFPDL